MEVHRVTSQPQGDSTLELPGEQWAPCVGAPLGGTSGTAGPATPSRSLDKQLRKRAGPGFHPDPTFWRGRNHGVRTVGQMGVEGQEGPPRPS